jgi:hypothetical protein
MSDGRLAAIDIGSDTIQMIVVQRERGNRLKHIERNPIFELGRTGRPIPLSEGRSS